MADGVEFRTRVVFNNFPKITAEMKATARKVVAKTAMDMEAAMKVRTPVDTGFLRNSIQARQVGGSEESGSVRWRVTVGAHYGLYVEYGTRHTRAQPFFFPAVAEIRPTFMEAMRRITG